MKNVLIPGRTTMTVVSDQDWRLELRLTGPIRLRGGAVVLPLERALETHPYLPADFLGLQPHVALRGPGSPDPQEFTRDWLELESMLQEYLTLGDPAGTYEFTLLGRLLNASGAPLTDEVSVTVQFEIQQWVDMNEPVLPDFNIALRDGATSGESWVVPITLRSNSDWTLTVAAGGRLVNESGTIEYQLPSLTVCSETGGPLCVPLSASPTLVAEGVAPPPFSVATVTVPVKFKFLTTGLIPVGQYGVSVLFAAHTGGARAVRKE